MSKVRIGIGSDHGGFDLKQLLVRHLKAANEDVDLVDFGVSSTDSVDYPDSAKPVVDAVLSGDVDGGILICGTGIGISMAANRNKGIRAAVVYDEDTARLAKAHNNANMICLGGRQTSLTEARKIVDLWLKTPFEEGRHQRRIDKLDA